MAAESMSADAERKVQVLKSAVVKLTRQKAEADERYAAQREELESERRRAAQLADELAHLRLEMSRASAAPPSSSTTGRWRFFRGANDTPPPPQNHRESAADSTILSDLMLQNERLHEELFDVRKALETKLKESEARYTALRSEFDEQMKQLQTLKKNHKPLESTSTSPTLPTSDPSPRAAFRDAPLDALVLNRAGAGDVLIHFVDFADTAQVLATALRFLLRSFASTTREEASRRFADLEILMSRQVDRIGKLWASRARVAECPKEISTALRALCLGLADHAALICQATAAGTAVTEAETRGAARALQDFAVSIATGCRALDDRYVLRVERAAAIRWKIVENFARTVSSRLGDARKPAIHAAIAELCDSLSGALGADSRVAAAVAPIDLSARVREILQAVEVQTAPLVVDPTPVGRLTWEPSTEAAFETMPTRQSFPEPGEASAVLRWLRLADDQAVFWRRQFELTMAELEERTASCDAKSENIAELKAALENERRERSWATNALQKQIEVLSEQLATRAASS